jgi:NADH:ubiquinone oxidoreductase subunit 3 (subunit A)
VLISISFILLSLSLTVVRAAFLLGASPLFSSEKTRPFECGFSPQAPPRAPLSIHFFLIAILFLIFDVELVLLFPFLLFSLPLSPSVIVLIVLLIILILGVLIE